MQIILYAQKENGQADTLCKAIGQLPVVDPVLVSTIDELCLALKSIRFGEAIVILLISSLGELDRLNRKLKQVFDIRIIIILPNADSRMLEKGLSLYPRYITQVEYGFKDVAAVMDKMIRNAAQNKFSRR